MGFKMLAGVVHHLMTSSPNVQTIICDAFYKIEQNIGLQTLVQIEV